ncbi:hypothetical protein BDW22DRAFT_1429140 [Trametopsis cervina]|nr:hypothetical protein BDW22DRAFT_1429140 [Trametopsis cervina]
MDEYFNFSLNSTILSDDEGGEITADNLDLSTPIGTPTSEVTVIDSSATIQVSDAFNFNTNIDGTPLNAILVSIDRVVFVAHFHRLRSASDNSFGGLLTSSDADPTRQNPITMSLPEHSYVVNVMLNTLYGIACDHYKPTFECLAAAVEAMRKYGMLPLDRYISRGTPLFNTLLDYAFLRPIETYALAGANHLEDLAVASSGYTLHLKLYQIAPELADKMGTRYLQRLHSLHSSRVDTLKSLLDVRIYPHVARSYCSVEQRQVISRAVQLGAAQVFYAASPATSRAGIESIFSGLVNSIECPDCKESVEAHIKDLVTKWTLVERTI